MSNEENYKISALTKLLNSSLITDVYPMVKEVLGYKLDEDRDYLYLKIIVDDYITYHNMYDNEFDPHYLVEYHIKRILPYVSLNITKFEWDVYTISGRYVVGVKSIGFGNFIFCKPDKDGNKLCK